MGDPRQTHPTSPFKRNKDSVTKRFLKFIAAARGAATSGIHEDIVRPRRVTLTVTAHRGGFPHALTEAPFAPRPLRKTFFYEKFTRSTALGWDTFA